MVIKEALRAGLDCVEQPAKCRTHKPQPRAVGFTAGRNIADIQELLAQIEGEGAR